MVPEPFCNWWGREKSLSLLVKGPAEYFAGITVTGRQCAGSPQWLSCKSPKHGKETEQSANNGHKDSACSSLCVSPGVALCRYQRATER